MYSLGFLSHKKTQSKCQCHCRTVRPPDFKKEDEFKDAILNGLEFVSNSPPITNIGYQIYWNSGIFLWNINTILEAFNEIMPEVCTKLTNGEEDFASCPNISIDYGIMEKANNVFVQLCDFDGQI